MAPNLRKSIGLFHSHFPWTFGAGGIWLQHFSDKNSPALTAPAETAPKRQSQGSVGSAGHGARSRATHEPAGWTSKRPQSSCACLSGWFAEEKETSKEIFPTLCGFGFFCCCKSGNFFILFLPGPGGEGAGGKKKKKKKILPHCLFSSSCKAAAGADVQTLAPQASIALHDSCGSEKKKDPELTRGIHAFTFQSSKARAP